MTPLLKTLAMRNLRLGRKVSIVMILLMLSASGAIWVVYELTSAQIEFARRELLGLELHAELRAMQKELQTFRGSSNAAIAGLGGAPDSARNARAATERAVMRIDEFHRRNGDALDSAAEWKEARAAWESLKALPPDTSPSARLVVNNTAVHALIRLMDRVTINSNLILDPGRDTYFVIESLIAREPRFTADLGQLRSLGLLIMSGNASAQEHRMLLELVILSRERGLAVRDPLAEGIRAKPSLTALLGESIAQEVVAANTLFDAADHIRQHPANSGIAPSTYFATGAAATAARYRLYEAGSRAIGLMLEERIGMLKVKRAATLGGVSLALLVSAGLLLLILQDVNRRLRLAVRSAGRLAAGRLQEGVPVRGRDEVGALMRSLASVASRLQEFSAAQLEIARHQGLGQTRFRIEEARFPGAYGEIAAKLNQLVDAHVAEQTRIIEAVQAYVRGDFALDPPSLPGDKAEITRALEEVRQLQSAFHDSPLPQLLIDIGSRRHLQVNAAWIEATGYARDAAVGRSAVEIGMIDQAQSEALYAARIAGRGRLDGHEMVIRRRDGEKRICQVWSRNIVLKGAELAVAWQIDVTERQRTEKALRESEADLATMFRHSPAALVVTAADDGRYLDVNQAWVDQMGCDREQALGRTSVELGIYDAAERNRVLAALAHGGTVERLEVSFRTAGGDTRSGLVSGREIELGGIRAHIWGTVDTTDQQRAQRQIEELNLILERSVASRTEALTKANAELQATLDSLRAAQEQLLRSEKQAALGRLVAGVAHELNTPIGNAVLVAGTLREKVGAFAAQVGAGLTRSTLNAHLAASSEAAEMIERNLDKAASLIQSFKQVSADQASSQRRVFQLDTVINELLFAHQPMLRKSPIAVSARIPAGIAMDSYPGPLGQVIGNLINNSLLHAHEGRASGVIAIEARPAGSNDVEIVVRDDGHGIAEDNLGRVFDPFYTTKLGRGGTGLGLPICQNLVTQILGGAMRIESAPGKGTAVLMTLPLKAPDAELEHDAPRKEAA